MTDLSCKYLGLNLRNPLIVGSSGLTSSIANLKTIDRMGAGAVVLKSVFEEQIEFETSKLRESDNPAMKSWNEAFREIVNKNEYYYDEAFEYLTGYAREHSLKQYLSLVSQAKESLSIPVIASINCNSTREWQFFAKKLQDAGADAIELNIYILPSDFRRTGQEIEASYFEIIHQVLKYVSIPVSVKTGYYFSSVARTLQELSATGIKGLTLFNRPFNPDIDIENLQVTSSNMFSSDTEYTQTLRWVALLSGRLACSIAASTGIHDHKAVIKQILAGADATHLVSLFYREPSEHFGQITKILENIRGWMDSQKFNSIADFKGKMSRSSLNNPASYERVQFIRLFSGIE